MDFPGSNDMADTAGCPPTQKQRCSWTLGGPGRDHVFQPALQLRMALWWSSGQQDINRSDVLHFQLTLKTTGLGSSMHFLPFFTPECQVMEHGGARDPASTITITPNGRTPQ